MLPAGLPGAGLELGGLGAEEDVCGPVEEFQQLLLPFRIQSMLRAGRWTDGPVTMPCIQKQPRPLLRMLSTNSQKGEGRRMGAEK